ALDVAPKRPVPAAGAVVAAAAPPVPWAPVEDPNSPPAGAPVASAPAGFAKAPKRALPEPDAVPVEAACALAVEAGTVLPNSDGFAAEAEPKSPLPVLGDDRVWPEETLEVEAAPKSEAPPVVPPKRLGVAVPEPAGAAPKSPPGFEVPEDPPNRDDEEEAKGLEVEPKRPPPPPPEAAEDVVVVLPNIPDLKRRPGATPQRADAETGIGGRREQGEEEVTAPDE
ncbi:hypothetical protein TGP89_360440, partial [Toxoplasma gondii p89]